MLELWCGGGDLCLRKKEQEQEEEREQVSIGVPGQSPSTNKYRI